MGKKQFTILIAILAVAVLAAVAVRSSRTSNVQASLTGVGEKVLPEFPINKVAEVSIVTADGSQTLKRNDGEEDSVWTIAERGGYPADFSKVSNLLRELWDLEITQNIEAGPSQFGRLGLAEPGGEGDAAADSDQSGTLMEFKDTDGAVLASLLVGDEYMRQSDTPSPFGGSGEVPAGRYLKPGGKDEVWLVSETLSSVDTTTENWLSKDFFKVERLKSIEKKSSNTEEDWKIARKTEGDDWRLLFLRPNELLDDAAASSVKLAFNSPRFDDVILGAKDVGEGATEFLIETFDDFKYTVGIGKELEDRKYHITVKVDAKLPAERKAEDGESEEDKTTKDEAFKNKLEQLEFKLKNEKKLEGWVYLVPNFVVSSLFKNRSEINSPSKPSEAAPPPGAGIPGQPGFPSQPQIPFAPQGPGAMMRPPGPVDPLARPAAVPPPPKPKPAAKPAAQGATAVTEPIEINFGKMKEEAAEKEKPAAKAEDAAVKEKPAVKKEKPAAKKETSVE